jgi:hypothetical protein
VENERNSRRFESVFSHKVRAGKRRTYFFDVRKTKGEDYYITLTESTKRFNGDGYERHKIFLYKEDFNRFMDGLKETVDHIKTELMPDYDYDEYTRRNQEWEERRAQLNEEENAAPSDKSETSTDESSDNESNTEKPDVESEEDMEW